MAIDNTKAIFKIKLLWPITILCYTTQLYDKNNDVKILLIVQLGEVYSLTPSSLIEWKEVIIGHCIVPYLDFIIMVLMTTLIDNFILPQKIIFQIINFFEGKSFIECVQSHQTWKWIGHSKVINIRRRNSFAGSVKIELFIGLTLCNIQLYLMVTITMKQIISSVEWHCQTINNYSESKIIFWFFFSS